MYQADSSVATLPQNDRVGSFNSPWSLTLQVCLWIEQGFNPSPNKKVKLKLDTPDLVWFGQGLRPSRSTRATIMWYIDASF